VVHFEIGCRDSAKTRAPDAALVGPVRIPTGQFAWISDPDIGLIQPRTKS
jgi:hypothetical protein